MYVKYIVIILTVLFLLNYFSSKYNSNRLWNEDGNGLKENSAGCHVFTVNMKRGKKIHKIAKMM